MTERRKEGVHLRPEDTQGREWLTNRHGVNEGRLVMTGEMSRVNQPLVTDTLPADPKFAGNGGT